MTLHLTAVLICAYLMTTIAEHLTMWTLPIGIDSEGMTGCKAWEVVSVGQHKELLVP